jgi:hypothetical protein
VSNWHMKDDRVGDLCIGRYCGMCSCGNSSRKASRSRTILECARMSSSVQVSADSRPNDSWKLTKTLFVRTFSSHSHSDTVLGQKFPPPSCATPKAHPPWQTSTRHNLVKTHYFLMIFKVLVLHGLSIWFASLWLCVLQQGAAALT